MKKINYEAHCYTNVAISVLLFHPLLRYKYSQQLVFKHRKYTEGMVFCSLLLNVPTANTLKMEAACSSEHREQLKIQHGAEAPTLKMWTPSAVETENIPTTSLLPFSLGHKVLRR
jgi:hypothetical protein